MDPGERLRAWWTATGADVGAEPASEAEVAALERRYSVSLPEDFRHYLLTSSPAGDDAPWDDQNGAWWTVNRIRNIPDEYQTPVGDPRIAAAADTWLFFADYMIWCWAWAICCGDGPERGRVAVIGGSPDRIVADSFSEFVDRYVEDSLKLM